jgi:hypothetical protein
LLLHRQRQLLVLNFCLMDIYIFSPELLLLLCLLWISVPAVWTVSCEGLHTCSNFGINFLAWQFWLANTI